MAILGHRSATMAATYSHISDPVLKEQYEKVIAAGGRLAGPAAEALLANRLDQDTLDWLKTSFFKTELELGHCLRTPAEGPCECDRWRAGGLIALLIGIAASTWITTTAPQVAGSPQERRRASSS